MKLIEKCINIVDQNDQTLAIIYLKTLINFHSYYYSLKN